MAKISKLTRSLDVDEEAGCALVGCGAIMLLYPVAALASLWALNTLFGLGLGYTVANVFAAMILMAAVE